MAEKISELLDRVGKYWSHQKQEQRRIWWHSAYLKKKVGERYTGIQFPSLIQADIHMLKQAIGERKVARAISVACGAGAKEMALIKEGLVQNFDLFEVSDKRISDGTQKSVVLGIENRIQFHKEDALKKELANVYDLVFWHHGLHHMLDTREAVLWSKKILKKGGIFYMNDYVGMNRLQWSNRSVSLANKIRSVLPDKYFYRKGKSPFPKNVRVIDKEKLIEVDPSECADSEKIIPSLSSIFANAEIKLLGGVVYHLALNDILVNISEQETQFFDYMMILDEFCIELGENAYAQAIAFND